GTNEKLAPGAFMASDRPTGIAARMVVINKPAAGTEAPAEIQPQAEPLPAATIQSTAEQRTEPITRTTPALGTPERDKLEADAAALDKSQEALYDKQRELQAEKQKTKSFTKKAEQLEAKISKVRDEIGASSGKHESLRKQRYRAMLEDAASQDDNTIL